MMRGYPPPKEYDWQQSTIGDHAESGRYQRIWCEDCRHELVINARDIIEKFHVPPETPYWTLTQKLVCGKCGSLKTGMMLASYGRAWDQPESL